LDEVYAALSFTLALMAVWGLVYWAWRAETDRSAYVGLFLLFGIPGVLLTIAGLAFGLRGSDRGWLAFAIGFALLVPLAKPFRTFVARFTPIDLESRIDLCGLAVVLAILVFNAYTLIQTPEPNLETGEVSLAGVAVQSVFEVALAFAAIGLWIYRTPRQAIDRLGLVRPTLRMVLIAFGVFFLGLLVNAGSYGLMSLFQHQYVDDYERVVDELASGSPGPLAALTFGIVVGIGEELLFRGAIQPRFGIVATAVIFASVHTQYGFTWILVGVFANGLLLGLLRRRYGTTACIITHLMVDTLAVLANNLS
jgi:membrane protease YdiL (CAAX protease family)